MVTKKENTTISLVKELLSVSCTLFLISLDNFVISINKYYGGKGTKVE